MDIKRLNLDFRGQVFWKVFALVLLIILVLFIVIFAFFYLNFFLGEDDKGMINPHKEKINTELDNSEFDVEPEHINYILYELEAYQLHAPPLSSEVPVIEVDVEGEIFNSKVIDGEIFTKKENADKEDIRIITKKEEVFNAIKSTNVAGEIKDSINSGDLKLEIVGDKKTLLLKGYLSLYDKFTVGDDEIDKGEVFGSPFLDGSERNTLYWVIVIMVISAFIVSLIISVIVYNLIISRKARRRSVR